MERITPGKRHTWNLKMDQIGRLFSSTTQLFSGAMLIFQGVITKTKPTKPRKSEGPSCAVLKPLRSFFSMLIFQGLNQTKNTPNTATPKPASPRGRRDRYGPARCLVWGFRSPLEVQSTIWTMVVTWYIGKALSEYRVYRRLPRLTWLTWWTTTSRVTSAREMQLRRHESIYESP